MRKCKNELILKSLHSRILAFSHSRIPAFPHSRILAFSHSRLCYGFQRLLPCHPQFLAEHLPSCLNTIHVISGGYSGPVSMEDMAVLPCRLVAIE